GVANITAAANQHPRFPPAHHPPLEGLIRESVRRHHHAGGRFPTVADRWVRSAHPSRRPVPVPPPRQDDDHHHGHHARLTYRQRAEMLITAMVMAAQADGQLDHQEQDQIVSQIQPLDREEADFLRRQFRHRHDVERFVRGIPSGMEYEVYSVSLMAIRLDTQAEANYLRSLADCMRMSPQEVRSIHLRMGAPTLD
ncbi:MAG: DUF533 domain-containing protein, partial [Planctomycetota bacterium]